jgi:hypothetical protein
MQFLQVRGPLKGRVGFWRVSPRPTACHEAGEEADVSQRPRGVA